MGGKALSKPTRRVQLDEYLQLKIRLTDLLLKFFKQVAVPHENPDKTSFGDLDFLVVPFTHEAFDAGQTSKRVDFNPLHHADLFPSTTECRVNVASLSFDFEGVQIDLILVVGDISAAQFLPKTLRTQDDTLIDMAMAAYSWGDFGAVLGRIVSALEIQPDAVMTGQCNLPLPGERNPNVTVEGNLPMPGGHNPAITGELTPSMTDNRDSATPSMLPPELNARSEMRSPHEFRLSYGLKGLILVAPSPYAKQKPTRILMSRCPRTIFAFLGLDYEVWKQGFHTEEQISDFLMTTRFFNPDLFIGAIEQEKGRYKSRVKRPMFASFLEKLKDASEIERLSAGSAGMGPRMTSVSLQELLSHFPNASEAYNTFVEQERVAYVFKSKWNTALVKQLTGMEDGVELGTFMRHAISELGGKEGVIASSEEHIRNTIIQMHQNQ